MTALPPRPAPPHLMPIEDLNRASRSTFAKALTPLFEVAPPLAEALSAGRPFASYAELIDRAADAARTLPETAQIEVANAHPRIGAPRASLSALSQREQGVAASGSADPAAIDAALGRLNDVYEQRFGFRFVVFVNRRSRAEILDVLRARLERPRAEELQTALRDMFLIARDRLSTLDAHR